MVSEHIRPSDWALVFIYVKPFYELANWSMASVKVFKDLSGTLTAGFSRLPLPFPCHVVPSNDLRKVRRQPISLAQQVRK